MTKKTNLKKHLLTSASVLALGAFSASQAGAAVLTSGTGPGANDTQYTVTSSINVSSGTVLDNGTADATGIVLIATGSVLTISGTAVFSHANNANAGPVISINTGSTLLGTGITNSATISNLLANSNAITASTTFGTISNTGSIITIGSGVGISVGASFTAITNGAAGIIQTATGSGVATSTAVSGAITNGASGSTNASIQATGAGNAILITGGTFTGDITNWGSLISAGTTAGTKATLNVLSTVAGNVYNKAGATISNSAAGAAVWLGGNVSGADGFSNAGTITATAASAAAFGINAALSGTIALITNASTGTIQAQGGGGAGINVANGTTVTALTNNGTIRADSGFGLNLATGGNITTLTNNALINDSATGVGLNFAGTSSATTVVNAGTISTTGAGTGILTAGAVTSTGVAITNSGSITTTTGKAISIATGAVTGTSVTGAIYNTSTGKIQATTGGSTGVVTVTSVALVNNTAYVAATGASAGLYNAGLINDAAAGVGLLLSTAGATAVSNVSGGTISTTGAGTAVSISGGAVTGTFFNGGSITSTTGTGMLVTGVALSKLYNTSTGIISTAASTGGAITLATTGAITDLTNAGTIKDTSTGAALNMTGTTGTTVVTNTGLITAANTSQSSGAVKVVADSGSVTIVNSVGGAITSTAGGAAIYFTATASRLGLITNSGTISASSATLNAVDFAASTAGSATITNTATGLITGNILTGITAGADTITLKGVNTAATTSTIGLNGNIVFGLASDIVSFEQASGTSQYYDKTITGASSTEKGILNAVTGTTYLTAAGTGVHTLASLSVSNGATLYFNGATTTTSTMSGVATVSGTLQVGHVNTLTTTSGVTENSGGVIVIDVKNTAGTITHGKIAGGAGTNSLAASATAIQVNYSSTGTAYTANNTMLANVLTGTGGITWTTGGTLFSAIGTASAVATGLTTSTLTGTGITLTDNSYILDFKAYRDATTATTVDIIATRANTYQSSSTLANVQALGTAFEAIGNAGDTALDTIHATLDGYTSAAQVNNALKTLDATTQTSGQTTQAVIAVSDAAGGTIENHMEMAMNETSGVATGGRSASSGVWGEVFGTAVDASERKGVAGYQADIGGFVLGADTAVNSQTRVGAAFAYANTDATGTANESTINSYQGSIYGSYDLGKLYYEGVGTFGYNSYDSSRTLFDASVATADFNGQQYSAKAIANYRVDVQGGLKVTPFVSAQYTFLTQDDYTETGSNANLHVDSDDINIFKTGLGTKLAYPISDNGVTYTPRLSAAWYYDLVGDEASTTSNFSSAATTTFASNGADVAQSEFKLGAGLDVLAQDNVTVSLDYSWDTKADFDAHTGELKARFEF